VIAEFRGGQRQAREFPSPTPMRSSNASFSTMASIGSQAEVLIVPLLDRVRRHVRAGLVVRLDANDEA
jgi:hypothetical protein